jgi:alpha-L-rhamnosidase
LDAATQEGPLQLCTDKTWRCRRSPRWVETVSRQHLWNGYREIYLAGMEDQWEEVEFDDSGWENARIVAKALDKDSIWPRLIEREIPFLHEEYITAQKVLRTDDNLGSISGEDYLTQYTDKQENYADIYTKVDASQPGSLPGITYDFGKEVVGYVELEIEAPKGGVVQLFCGESLEVNLYDTFILKQGTNRLSAFGRRAFRYLQISVQATPEPIIIKRLLLKFVHYPFKNAGSFQSSDPLLNKIWDVGVYTTQVNSQDHFEDSILREKALWIVDAVVMGKVIYHVFGDTLLLRKCLLQSARIQNKDGSIPANGPERTDFLLPDFCAQWLFGVYTYFSYTGDKSFLQEVWPTVLRLMEWFRRHESANGLFSIGGHPDWWCFIDWSGDIDKRECVTALSCYYYKALLEASEMAGYLGQAAMRKHWVDRAETLRRKLRDIAWSKKDRAFVDCITRDGKSRNISLQTNYAAIWSGVMDDDEADYFIHEYHLKHILPDIKGAFFYHIVLETLFKRDYDLEALNIIRSYWGEMIARGATTWWETFDASTPHCTVPSYCQGHTPTYLCDHIPVSYSHGWGSSPSYLLTQHVLGVHIFDMGQKRIGIRPRTGNVEWAKGEIPTPFGSLRISWTKQADGTIDYNLEIPNELQLEILEKDQRCKVNLKRYIRKQNVN